MSEPFVAVIVRVPEEYFSDDDDICLTAGNYVCSRLESHLIANKHSIPDWIRGGCEEDWGVYFKSQWNDQSFDYAICFAPADSGEEQYWMMIQYHLIPRLFAKWRKLQTSLGADHALHRTMQVFAETFDASRMLTQKQFDSEY